MNKIEFRKIEGYSRYLVCNHGYIVTENGIQLKGTLRHTGYYEVCLYDDQHKAHYELVHRIVAKYFCENPNKKEEVNHKDGDKQNNDAKNLEWVTRNENLTHAFVSGLRKDDVSAKSIVGTNLKTGEKIFFHSIYEAAHRLHISKGNICMCCKGKRPYASGYYWEYENKVAL